MAMVSLNSNVGLGVIVAAIGGVWGIYMFLSPIFNTVNSNEILIQSQKSYIDRVDTVHTERMERMEKMQDTYQEHIMSISSDISEIKATIKAANR